MKPRKTSSHEFCQGYYDSNGVWNNGFECRKWGGPNEKYCCENLNEIICCPEPSSTLIPSTSPQPSFTLPTSVISQSSSFSFSSTHTPSNNFNDKQIEHGKNRLGEMYPVMIGVSVGVMMMLFCLLLVSILCCCCCHNRKKKKRSNQPIIVNKTLPFNLEAEATSAVIDAQALQQQQQQQNSLINKNKDKSSDNNITNLSQRSLQINTNLNNGNHSNTNSINKYTFENNSSNNYFANSLGGHSNNKFSGSNTNKHHNTSNNTNPNNTKICSYHDNQNITCSCKLSPSTSRSTVLDLDCLIATMQQNINTNNNNNNNSIWLQQNFDHCPQTSTSNYENIKICSVNNSSSFPKSDSLLAEGHKMSYRNVSSNPSPSLLDPCKNRGFGKDKLEGDLLINDLRQFKKTLDEMGDQRSSGVLLEEPDIVQFVNSSVNSVSSSSTFHLSQCSSPHYTPFHANINLPPFPSPLFN